MTKTSKTVSQKPTAKSFGDIVSVLSGGAKHDTSKGASAPKVLKNDTPKVGAAGTDGAISPVHALSKDLIKSLQLSVSGSRSAIEAVIALDTAKLKNRDIALGLWAAFPTITSPSTLWANLKLLKIIPVDAEYSFEFMINGELKKKTAPLFSALSVTRGEAKGEPKATGGANTSGKAGSKVTTKAASNATSPAAKTATVDVSATVSAWCAAGKRTPSERMDMLRNVATLLGIDVEL